MSFNIVPLTTNPNQSMSITFPIDGKNIILNLIVRYNLRANYWVMTISDSNGITLVDSLPLVSGQYPAADVLEQYGFLGIGSAFVINASSTDLDIPNDISLGVDHFLMWGDRV